MPQEDLLATAEQATAFHRTIRTVALVHLAGRKVLLVRSKDKDAYYMPGGKPHPGEDDRQALIREISEELNVDLVEESIAWFGVFSAQAYGEANGTKVRIACYMGTFTGEPQPNREVLALDFFSYSSYAKMPFTAPAVHAIMQRLKKVGVID